MDIQGYLKAKGDFQVFRRMLLEIIDDCGGTRCGCDDVLADRIIDALIDDIDMTIDEAEVQE